MDRVKINFKARRLILPGEREVIIRIMEEEELYKVKNSILSSHNYFPHENLSKDMLHYLSMWPTDVGHRNMFFLIGVGVENGDILGVASGSNIPHDEKIYGVSKLTINTSGVRGIGRELFKSKMDTFFSVPKIDIVYAIPNDKSKKSKAKYIMETLGFKQELHENSYFELLRNKFYPHIPHSLVREKYEKMKKMDKYPTWRS